MKYRYPVWLRGAPLGKAKMRCCKMNLSFRTQRILTALLVLIMSALLPMAVWFSLISSPFTALPVTCTDVKDVGLETAQQNRSGGIQTLFTIDRSFNSYPFSTVKFIDVVWDLCVARGLQFFAGWVSYAAITGAVVRAMESGPISYEIFVGLALNGSNVSAISTATNLYRCRPLRTTILLGSIILSMVYVVMLPTLLSAATGYVASTDTFISLTDTDQLVPLSAVTSVNYKFSIGNSSEEYCLGDYNYDDKTLEFQVRAQNQMLCCKPVNCLRFYSNQPMSEKEWNQLCSAGENSAVSWKGSQCAFEGNGTFNRLGANYTYREASCNTPLNITINNVTFDGWSAVLDDNDDNHYCYNGKVYNGNWRDLHRTAQCLPASGNAGHARYEWGFSTVLMSLILISHCIWSLFMLGLWLDAELNGALQRESGFKLSQVRAALIVAEAATRTTGRSLTDLIRYKPKEIRQRLGRKDATIPFEVLRQEPNVFLASLSPNPDDTVSASSLFHKQTLVQYAKDSDDKDSGEEVQELTDLAEQRLL